MGENSRQIRRRILLCNDTGALPNPGCRAVRKAYELLFGREIPGTAITGSLPVRYWDEHFKAIAIPAKNAILHSPGCFPTSRDAVNDIDFEQWERIRNTTAQSDVIFQEALRASDLVVINAEGSIHHNSVRALSLLALAKTAMAMDKKVLLLNATIQAMSPRLLQEVLPNITLIHARESATRDYLSLFGIDAVLAADLAFHIFDEENSPQAYFSNTSREVLVTLGVTANKQTISKTLSFIKSIHYSPVYLSIGDGGESSIACECCNEYNIPFIDAGKMSLNDVINFIRQFSFAVSGRHHMNIFFMKVGIPFCPLPSNTWKIEAALKLVGYPLKPVQKYADFIPSLRNVFEARQELTTAGGGAYLTGKASLPSLFQRIAACM